MLVVAKGTLIDWSEIYSAVTDREGREEGRGGLLQRTLPQTGESQSGTSHVPGGFQ